MRQHPPCVHGADGAGAKAKAVKDGEDPDVAVMLFRDRVDKAAEAKKRQQEEDGELGNKTKKTSSKPKSNGKRKGFLERALVPAPRSLQDPAEPPATPPATATSASATPTHTTPRFAFSSDAFAVASPSIWRGPFAMGASRVRPFHTASSAFAMTYNTCEDNDGGLLELEPSPSSCLAPVVHICCMKGNIENNRQTTRYRWVREQ